MSSPTIPRRPAPTDGWSGLVIDGRYRIGRLLGEGGMGEAYLARDLRLERWVVVKRPHASLLADASERLRFLREIRSLTRLEHPFVLKILDAGAGPDYCPFAVMPYLPGGNLRDVLASRARWSVRDLRVWLPAMACALDYVHGHGYVHGDVKPANVLFDESGNAILSDFGLVHALAPDAPDGELEATPGSPAYMGPEVIGGGAIGPAYDQYALAVMVHEALAGERPFDDTSVVACLLHKRASPPRPLRDLGVHVTAAEEAAVLRALARDPAARFPRCASFVRALDPEAPLPSCLPPPAATPDVSGPA